MQGTLYGVSVGPGDPGLLTLKAVKILREADVIAIPAPSEGKPFRKGSDSVSMAYKIAAAAYPEITEKPLLCLPMPMIRDEEELERIHREDAAKVAAWLDEGKQVAFLTIGDVSIYSTFQYLKKHVEEMGYDTCIIPGVPSFCAAAASLGISLGERQEEIHILPAAYAYEKGIKLPGTKILMKAGKNLQGIRKALIEGAESEPADEWETYPENRPQVLMVENCGMENERVYRSLEEIPDVAGYYTLLVIKEK